MLDRKQAYLDFAAAWRHARDRYYDRGLERSIYDDPPPDVWQPLYDLVDGIHLFGDDDVAMAATQAVDRLTAWVGVSDQVVHERAREMNRAYEDFLAHARRSLGVQG